jgi:DNA-directed RNA polymerase specialized sigma24 family protein
MEIKDLYIWSHYRESFLFASKLVESVEMAKDITSDALTNIILLCRSSNAPNLEQDAMPYIKRTIRNLVNNHNRREKLKIELLQHEVIQNPVDNLEIEDFYKILRKCSPSVIRIIETKLDGLSTREGAKELNIEESVYKMRWHRAKKELQKKFEYMNS